MKKKNRSRLMDRKIVEYIIQEKKQRWISRELKVGDRKIRNLRKKAKEYGYLSGVPLPPYPEAVFPDAIDGRTLKNSEFDIVLFGKKEWIKDRLDTGWRPITVFEELNLKIPRASFYRYLHRHKLFNLGKHYRRVVPEIVHQPGEALQLDWGKIRDVIDPETKKKKTLWEFVGVMGYSRYTMVRLVWSNDIPTTLCAIESMFVELGGVPFKITTDNPKCFATEASDYEPILNPAFERFAAHYQFIIECLPPRDPQKKGKVERMISYTRRLYEAHGLEWHGLEESQSYMTKKLVIANERKHGTTQHRPIDDFLKVEINFLKPLPPVSYQMEEFSEATVRKDGHVRFNNKYYSVDETHIGVDVFIIASLTQVTIYLKGKLIEVHDRLTDAMRSKQTKNHHLKPWEQSMKEDSSYRKRARKIGPDVERLILILLEQGQGFIDTRKIWGILSLDKKFKNEAINLACRDAIGLQSYSYRTVRTLLNIQYQPTEEKFTQKLKRQNKFTRPLSEYAKQTSLKLN